MRQATPVAGQETRKYLVSPKSSAVKGCEKQSRYTNDRHPGSADLEAPRSGGGGRDADPGASCARIIPRSSSVFSSTLRIWSFSTSASGFQMARRWFRRPLGGQGLTCSVRPSLVMTPRSTMFSSSLTSPGHEYSLEHLSVGCVTRRIGDGGTAKARRRAQSGRPAGGCRNGARGVAGL